jgi:hypothetical protein
MTMGSKILVEIRHPAHVHHFKHFIWGMEKRGYEVLVCTTDKEITLQLLEAYGINYKLIGRNRAGLLNKFFDLLRFDFKVYRIAKEFQPDIYVGRASPSLAHISTIFRKPYISFSDTEHAKLIFLVTEPFMSAIATPRCFKKDFGKKHFRYDGYHELAYLHKNYFQPNESVLEENGLTSGEKFFILRFVSWESSHDIGQSGFNPEYKLDLVNMLNEYGRVLITSEGELPKELRQYQISVGPEKIHDLLAYATLYFGESPTMTTEIEGGIG